MAQELSSAAQNVIGSSTSVSIGLLVALFGAFVYLAALGRRFVSQKEYDDERKESKAALGKLADVLRRVEDTLNAHVTEQETWARAAAKATLETATRTAADVVKQAAEVAANVVLTHLKDYNLPRP